jgi:HEAT repeat protein
MRALLMGVLGLCVFAATYAEGAEVRDLVKKLADSDNEVRRAAAKDLAELGTEAKAAVPALRKSLRDRDLFVRRFSAEALSKIGPDARDAVPELALALNDDRSEVSRAAVEALAAIGAPSIDALKGALRDPAKPAEVRRKAAVALGQIGLQARGAVGVLTDIVNGKY